ncbi:hypothetical protein ACFSF0_02420 [Ottowia flava]|uniref:Uncharacterized protein n=1 Tax=Ottowia flava TaxID=2675430 RepID=A0ABW4KT56_9BURK
MAQRLNRRSVEDADEKRAKRFFADARLPSGERAELEDYRNSGKSIRAWYWLPDTMNRR